MKYQAQMRGPGNDAAASSLFAACATGSMIGEETGFTGMLLASLIGALTTVGIITILVEVKYLGRKTAILRNVLAFLFSFITAYLMGVFLK